MSDVNCRVEEIKADKDHLHFLLQYPPTVDLSSVIGTLKGKSAKRMLDNFGSFLYGKHERTLWSSGYFLCSVGGATLEILKSYIENHGSPQSTVNEGIACFTYSFYFLNRITKRTKP